MSGAVPQRNFLTNSDRCELCLPFRMESSQGFIRRDNDRELAADSLQRTAGNRDVTFLILQTACQLSMRHPCNVAVLRPIARPGFRVCAGSCKCISAGRFASIKSRRKRQLLGSNLRVKKIKTINRMAAVLEMKFLALGRSTFASSERQLLQF